MLYQMSKYFITILSIFFFCFSCNQSKQLNTSPEVKNSKKESITAPKFNYENFKIQKGALGEITIGMTITEAESKFSGLRKEVGYATDFGFGGGSPAYLYYDNESVVFGLIPKLDTDTLMIIIAVSPKLKTINGLTPNSTVKEIAKVCPDIKAHQNLMANWEEMYDHVNDWDFVFMTDVNKTIGSYPELEEPSELINTDITADWIAIN